MLEDIHSVILVLETQKGTEIVVQQVKKRAVTIGQTLFRSENNHINTFYALIQRNVKHLYVYIVCLHKI